MANANSTATLSLHNVCDLLTQTEYEISFIQSITLLCPTNEDLTLDSTQVTGLYYLLNTIKKNIEKASEQISSISKNKGEQS